jgi:hypothetical protein
MSEITLGLHAHLADRAAAEGDVSWEAIERLADRVDAAIMGIGEVVGCDYDYETGEFALLLGGDDPDRLITIAVPLVRTMGLLPGSYYTVEGPDQGDRTEPPPRISF